MIIGEFKEEHPRITTRLIGPDIEIELEFLVDTGFAGDIKVSPSIVARLQLPFIGRETRKLANGDVFSYNLCEGTIDWVDGLREVDVLAMDGESLIGTGLIQGMMLEIEGVEGGSVQVQSL